MKDFILHKREGKVTNRAAAEKWWNAIEDGKHLLSRKNISRRTLKQNDYLHLIFGIVQQGLYDAGYREIKTKEDAKFVCKDLFFFKEIQNGLGGKIKVHKKTSEATKEEIAVFIQEIQQWASEYLGIVIEDPNTQTSLFTSNQAA